MASALEQYPISDFLEWHRKRALELNPDFQRRAVWTPAAKTYLIDTILRDMPVPKIYLRTTINAETQKAVRDVVDGQQRLRAIIEFANGKLRLTKRAREFSNLRFGDLSEEQKLGFLGYRLAVDQLFNANDEDVLEVFWRLNSYTVTLNSAEKRHAKFQGAFKDAVHDSARKWKQLWEKHKLVSVAQRLRMGDDSFMAEMYGIVLEGLGEGDERTIDRLYERHDETFESNQPETTATIDRVLRRLVKDLGSVVDGPLASRPHFIVLFAAVAHAEAGIAPGIMGDAMPQRGAATLSDVDTAQQNLTRLAAILDEKELPGTGVARSFWLASQSNTVRQHSRRIRFPIFWQALQPEALQL